jgi:hypothetical protein
LKEDVKQLPLSEAIVLGGINPFQDKLWYINHTLITSLKNKTFSFFVAAKRNCSQSKYLFNVHFEYFVFLFCNFIIYSYQAKVKQKIPTKVNLVGITDKFI